MLGSLSQPATEGKRKMGKERRRDVIAATFFVPLYRSMRRHRVNIESSVIAIHKSLISHALGTSSGFHTDTHSKNSELREIMP